MRAVVYSRVSTDGQEKDGTSLETQEQAAVEYARANGWPVIEPIRDAASGFVLERPGMERLRRLLDEGLVDVVVAYSVDRLSRNQNHIGVLFDEVQRAGARLEFVTEKFEDTAVGRFILAARAFVAEVEREKIAERTMRGKTERARSGRIPQATGKGCYGYVYDPLSGRRSIQPAQAEVVRRIFTRYAETRSLSAVSQTLNKAGIPALTGGRWYPLTVRRVLTNESYTGRLVYRRTKRVKSYHGRVGKVRSRIVVRPEAEWIEIQGASPPIIDQALWERVQTILEDPERTRRQPTENFYALRSRAKCGVCGGAMVGQTLNVGGKPYRYYRCRHIYDKNVSYECSARYVGADALEAAVWREVTQVLTRPEVVLQELMARADEKADQSEVARLESELAALNERERRLVRLYGLGAVQERAVQDEITQVTRERVLLQERLAPLRRPHDAARLPLNLEDLKATCTAVAAWLGRAGQEERVLALEALQVTVRATRNNATLAGVLPATACGIITSEHTCQCL